MFCRNYLQFNRQFWYFVVFCRSALLCSADSIYPSRTSAIQSATAYKFLHPTDCEFFDMWRRTIVICLQAELRDTIFFFFRSILQLRMKMQRFSVCRKLHSFTAVNHILVLSAYADRHVACCTYTLRCDEWWLEHSNSGKKSFDSILATESISRFDSAIW